MKRKLDLTLTTWLLYLARVGDLRWKWFLLLQRLSSRFRDLLKGWNTLKKIIFFWSTHKSSKISPLAVSSPLSPSRFSFFVVKLKMNVMADSLVIIWLNYDAYKLDTTHAPLMTLSTQLTLHKISIFFSQLSAICLLGQPSCLSFLLSFQLFTRQS